MLVEFLDFVPYAFAIKKGWFTVAEFFTILKKEFLNPLLLASSYHYAYFQLSTLRTRFILLGWVLMGHVTSWAYYKRRPEVNDNNNVISKATTK